MKPLGNEPSNILEPPQPEEGKKAWEDYADTLTTELQEARATIDRLEERLKLADDLGLEFGMMKTSDKPEPWLCHTLREGSDLWRIQQEWMAGIGEPERADRAEAQRDTAWAADKVIRGAINANKEEATSDEVARVVAQLQGCRAALRGWVDHSQEDRIIRAHSKLMEASCAALAQP